MDLKYKSQNCINVVINQQTKIRVLNLRIKAANKLQIRDYFKKVSLQWKIYFVRW